MARSKPLEAITVTAAELAELLEVDQRTVYRLAADEGLPRIRRGEYPLFEAVTWYVRRLKTQAEVKARDPSIDEDRRRLLIAQAEKCELENEQTRGTLVSADLVAGVLNRIGSIVASELEAAGPRSAQLLAGMTDPAAVMLYRRDEAAGIRESISGEIDAFAALVRDGEHRSTATEEECGPVGGLVSETPAGIAGAGEMAH
jgi:phage terminase Nu1 subunit (DNA packaging protein)